MRQFLRKLSSRILLLPLLGCLLAPPWLGAQEDRPVRPERRLEAVIPFELRHLLMSQPHAAVLVGVDAEGRILDLMPFSATHYGLLEKAVEVVRAAHFKPAIVDGRAASGRAKVYVNFFDPEQRAWRQGGIDLPLGSTVSEGAERRMYEIAPDRFRYDESKPAELDAMLTLKRSTLRLYVGEDGVRHQGRCVVEYFVGPDGRVHFPRIVSSDHENLSMSAILTLRDTEFEPPLRGGRPTWVRVRQPFNFRE